MRAVAELHLDLCLGYWWVSEWEWVGVFHEVRFEQHSAILRYIVGHRDMLSTAYLVKVLEGVFDP